MGKEKFRRDLVEGKDYTETFNRFDLDSKCDEAELIALKALKGAGVSIACSMEKSRYRNHGWSLSRDPRERGAEFTEFLWEN